MTINYEYYASRVEELLSPDIKNSVDREMYLFSKLASETIELYELGMDGLPDLEAILDESGDIMYYTTALCNSRKIPFKNYISATSYSELKDLCLEDMICGSGKMLGEYAKVKYHKKSVKDEYFVNKLGEFIAAFTAFCHSLGFSITKVMECNLQKLEERHGKTYKGSFYTGV